MNLQEMNSGKLMPSVYNNNKNTIHFIHHLAETPRNCVNTATADTTFLHLITTIALKGVEADSAEPLQGEVVTGTIWAKPCNPN